MRKSNVVWMRLSGDEYDLPIAVGNSARELATILGTKEQRVIERVYQEKKKEHPLFMKVRIDEVEE